MDNITLFAFRPDHGAPPEAPGKTPGSVVSLRNFTRRFGKQVVLDSINLTIAGGEFVALLGRSGSGKTTLLRTLAGLDAVREGEVTVPAARAVVFQEPRLMPWKRVWSNVLIGLDQKALGGKKKAHERALHALNEVGLGHRAGCMASNTFRWRKHSALPWRAL